LKRRETMTSANAGPSTPVATATFAQDDRFVVGQS
jgi:hypothetical protein